MEAIIALRHCDGSGGPHEGSSGALKQGDGEAVCLPMPAALPRDEEGSTAECPSAGQCSRLPSSCVCCHYHHNCTYGQPTAFTCKPKRGVHCLVSLQGIEPTWAQWDQTLYETGLDEVLLDSSQGECLCSSYNTK